jgi:DNA-binding NtrC family response regulator
MILLLSSEPMIREVMKEALERAGYVVFATGSLGVAVDTLGDTRVELLITHPYVETMSGYAAAKYLRGKHPYMAVLLVAGVMEDDRLGHRSKIEQIEIFPPPFSAADLTDKVRQVLKTAPQSR